MVAKHRRLVGAASVAAPAVRALVLLRESGRFCFRFSKASLSIKSPDRIDGELACLDQLHGEGKAGFSQDSSSKTRCSPLQYNYTWEDFPPKAHILAGQRIMSSYKFVRRLRDCGLLRFTLVACFDSSHSCKTGRPRAAIV